MEDKLCRGKRQGFQPPQYWRDCRLEMTKSSINIPQAAVALSYLHKERWLSGSRWKQTAHRTQGITFKQTSLEIVRSSSHSFFSNHPSLQACYQKIVSRRSMTE